MRAARRPLPSSHARGHKHSIRAYTEHELPGTPYAHAPPGLACAHLPRVEHVDEVQPKVALQPLHVAVSAVKNLQAAASRTSRRRPSCSRPHQPTTDQR